MDEAERQAGRNLARTLDLLGEIKLGDEVQLDIRAEIPFARQFGMQDEHHGLWVTVIEVTSVAEDYFKQPGAPPVYHVYHCRGHNAYYGFTVLNIMGWRRPGRKDG